MNMFRAFMELDEAYNDRQFHIDELKKAGKNYNFNKYTDAQLYRMWQRLQKPTKLLKEPEHELDLDFEPERDFEYCDCGVRLNDMGTCPVCDLGEEDLTEAVQDAGLSNAQKVFFADSKIRDSQGNLMVFYHGTNKEFPAFDPKTVGQGGPLGIGYYFSSKGETGKVFGNVKAVYLNIKNPMIFTTAKQPRDFLISMCKKYQISPASAAKTGKSANYQVTELLQKDGYDGVLCYFSQLDEYWCVAYSPEQIKSVNNLSPTTSPNMNEGIFDKPTMSSWVSATGKPVSIKNNSSGQSTPTQTQQTPKPHLPSGKYAVRIVSHGGRLRALATDGVHPAAFVAFPNNLRQFEGQQYEVDQLIWNGKNYRVAGNIVEI